MNQTQTYIALAIADIEAFIAKADIKETTFGMRAVADATVIERLRQGKVTLRTVEKIQKYINENQKSSGAN
jgi:hypothetical protein